MDRNRFGLKIATSKLGGRVLYRVLAYAEAEEMPWSRLGRAE